MLVVVQYGPTEQWRVVDTLTGVVVNEFPTQVEATNYLQHVTLPPTVGKGVALPAAHEAAPAPPKKRGKKA
jgi:hypothetical protein